ncbi:MAG: hypothetical protein M0Q46_06175 [Endomicrobiales bacterium]|nr:hypothetical protein [Endomicrobiales bacterium]
MKKIILLGLMILGICGVAEAAKYQIKTSTQPNVVGYRIIGSQSYSIGADTSTEIIFLSSYSAIIPNLHLTSATFSDGTILTSTSGIVYSSTSFQNYFADKEQVRLSTTALNLAITSISSTTYQTYFADREEVRIATTALNNSIVNITSGTFQNYFADKQEVINSTTAINTRIDNSSTTLLTYYPDRAEVKTSTDAINLRIDNLTTSSFSKTELLNGTNIWTGENRYVSYGLIVENIIGDTTYNYRGGISIPNTSNSNMTFATVGQSGGDSGDININTGNSGGGSGYHIPGDINITAGNGAAYSTGGNLSLISGAGNSGNGSIFFLNTTNYLVPSSTSTVMSIANNAVNIYGMVNVSTITFANGTSFTTASSTTYQNYFADKSLVSISTNAIGVSIGSLKQQLDDIFITTNTWSARQQFHEIMFPDGSSITKISSSTYQDYFADKSLVNISTTAIGVSTASLQQQITAVQNSTFSISDLAQKSIYNNFTATNTFSNIIYVSSIVWSDGSVSTSTVTGNPIFFSVSPSTGIDNGYLADGIKITTGNISASGTPSATTFLSGAGSWAEAGGGVTVTSLTVTEWHDFNIGEVYASSTTYPFYYGQYFWNEKEITLTAVNYYASYLSTVSACNYDVVWSSTTTGTRYWASVFSTTTASVSLVVDTTTYNGSLVVPDAKTVIPANSQIAVLFYNAPATGIAPTVKIRVKFTRWSND